MIAAAPVTDPMVFVDRLRPYLRHLDGCRAKSEHSCACGGRDVLTALKATVQALAENGAATYAASAAKARRTDPATSQQVAEELSDPARLRDMHRVVLGIFEQAGERGLTADELVLELDFSPEWKVGRWKSESGRKRVGPLVDFGWLKDSGETRVGRSSGKSQRVVVIARTDWRR